MPRVNKYLRKSKLIGGAVTPQTMVKTVKQAEKLEDAQVKADRQKLFRAWTRF